MNKTVPTGQDVGAFLASLTDETQRRDSQALVRLMTDVSGEPAAMWGSSIIGFGQTRLVYESGRELDWLIMGFSPRKGKFALYLPGGPDGLRPQLDELGTHKVGKSCIYVNRLADVDGEGLRSLIAAAWGLGR